MKTLITIAALALGGLLHSCYERVGIYDCSLAGRPQIRINGAWKCW